MSGEGRQPCPPTRQPDFADSLELEGGFTLEQSLGFQKEKNNIFLFMTTDESEVYENRPILNIKMKIDFIF